MLSKVSSMAGRAAGRRSLLATSRRSLSSRIQLYQYHICPFCNIAKALLAYSDTKYDAVEVSAPQSCALFLFLLFVIVVQLNFSLGQSPDQGRADAVVGRVQKGPHRAGR